MRVGGADRRDDAFADAGDDRLLGGPADQPGDVGPHRYAGFHLELDAVLGHAVDRNAPGRRVRGVDDLRIHAGMDGVDDVAAGQVDRTGRAIVQ